MSANIKNSKNNIKHLEKSAENDKEYNLALSCLHNHITQYNLAYLYKNGKGIEKNLEKAFYWCKKSAETGNNNVIMNNLALFYYNGDGTEKNLEKAFYWHQKAAENGYNIAMNNLASLYKNGEGTEKNLEKAFYW